MKLPIVEPRGSEKEIADAVIRQGSVCVLVPALVDGSAVVYYEGGVYTRPEHIPPNEQERISYAKIAAGRAWDNYPTVARLFTLAPRLWEQVGYVDTDTWEVVFDDA